MWFFWLRDYRDFIEFNSVCFWSLSAPFTFTFIKLSVFFFGWTQYRNVPEEERAEFFQIVEEALRILIMTFKIVRYTPSSVEGRPPRIWFEGSMRDMTQVCAFPFPCWDGKKKAN